VLNSQEWVGLDDELLSVEPVDDNIGRLNRKWLSVDEMGVEDCVASMGMSVVIIRGFDAGLWMFCGRAGAAAIEGGKGPATIGPWSHGG